jgi:hypothetical protein
MPRPAAKLAKKRERKAAKARARLLRAIRKFARDPRGLTYIVHIGKRRVFLYHDDITARTNKQLLAFIRQQCSE